MTAPGGELFALADGVHSFAGPRQVLAGPGALDRIPEVLERWRGADNAVLIVCDAIVARLGHGDALVDGLRRAGWEVEVFDGVSGEPDGVVARAAGEAVRRRRFAAVIGLGGGSAMDVAKVTAALGTHDVGVEDLVGVGRLVSDPLPLVLVPTTAGTGSEATPVAMLLLDGAKSVINDGRLLPLVAVLDSHLVRSTPPAVTAATGLDALGHAIEGALSTAASPLSRRAALDAVALVAEWLPRAVEDGDDLAARQATVYAAYLAGLALNGGSILGHSIAYTIAHRTGLPHGVTVAIALPYCIAYSRQAAAPMIARLWRAVPVSRRLGADDLAGWVLALSQRLGIPSELRSLGLDEQAVAEMAHECVTRYPRPHNPEPLALERIHDLYRSLLDGDLESVAAAARS